MGPATCLQARPCPLHAQRSSRAYCSTGRKPAVGGVLRCAASSKHRLPPSNTALHPAAERLPQAGCDLFNGSVLAGSRRARRSHARLKAAADPPPKGLAENSSGQWEQTQDGGRSYLLLLAVLLLGLTPGADNLAGVLDLPYFLLLATFSVYIAAHRSVTANKRQQITLSQGALAPVAASVVLFGSYLLIKALPQLTLQRIFNAYFFSLGTFAVAGGVKAPLQGPAAALARPLVTKELPEGFLTDEQGNSISSASVSTLDILTLLLGLGVATADLMTGHRNHTLNNSLACLIVVDILQLVGFNSFRVAGVMMVGLLVYDVFWVFGSSSVVGENVMMKMATSDVLSGPVRLLFPHAIAPGTHPSFPFSLLGLGDIAVPGLLIALSLRFDAHLGQDGTPSPPGTGMRLPARKPYFWTAMVAYLAGLLLAFSARLWSNEGQPALLYIVPCMLGASALTAGLRGQLKNWWEYKEESVSILK